MFRNLYLIPWFVFCYVNIVYFCLIIIENYLHIGHIDFFSEHLDAKILIQTSVRDLKSEHSDSG